MITLKSKINKSKFLRNSRFHALDVYMLTYQSDKNIDTFMEGVKYTLNELQIKK